MLARTPVTRSRSYFLDRFVAPSEQVHRADPEQAAERQVDLGQRVRGLFAVLLVVRHA